MALFDAIIKPALESVNNIINDFHMSPEDKAKAQQAIADAAAKAQADSYQYDIQLNSIAGANIQADAKSGDKYTMRARPSFMYVIIGTLAFNYIGLPLAQIFGSVVKPIELPTNLLILFGTCMTGYSFMRTAEKISAMPGDSQISIPLVKVGNKN